MRTATINKRSVNSIAIALAVLGGLIMKIALPLSIMVQGIKRAQAKDRFSYSNNRIAAFQQRLHSIDATVKKAVSMVTMLPKSCDWQE